MLNLQDRIILDPAIVRGRPIIRGTRRPLTVIVGGVAGGMTFEEIQREYDIAADDISGQLCNILLTSYSKNSCSYVSTVATQKDGPI